ncbi:aminotransferase class IV [Cryomorphaceae bacterium 1068]|nr:aminotransferase class IV [Cryomorphaceae bacterium 1068]
MSLTQPKYLINGYLSEGAESDFLSRNRAFRLGDGFFETIRVVDGHIPFWDAHYKRLSATCKALRMEMSPVFESKFLRKSLQELISAQQIREGGRLRITVFREGGGAYTSDSNRAGYVAEVVSYFPNRFVVPDRGASLGTFTDLQKTPGKLSKFKLMGNHYSLQAAAWAKAEKFSEALILNDSGRIAETTSGNIFTVKGGKVRTPGLKEGGVAGVMRMALINVCLQEGIPVYESDLDETDILAAEEVFFSNAIIGVQWVGSFRHKRFYHKLSDFLVDALNERVKSGVEV